MAKRKAKVPIPLDAQLNILNSLKFKNELGILENRVGKFHIGTDLEKSSVYIKYIPVHGVSEDRQDMPLFDNEIEKINEELEANYEDKSHISLLVTCAEADKEKSPSNIEKHYYLFQEQLGQEGGEGRNKRAIKLKLNDQGQFIEDKAQSMVKRRPITNWPNHQGYCEFARKEAQIALKKYKWMQERGMLPKDFVVPEQQMASIMVRQSKSDKDFNVITPMPMFPGESLNDFLTNKHPFTFNQSVDVALQAAIQVAYHHDQDEIHGDIKRHNFIYDKDSQLLYLGDCSGVIKKGEQATMHVTGPYKAPEVEFRSVHVIDNSNDNITAVTIGKMWEKVTQKSDLYSLMLVVLDLFGCGLFAFEHRCKSKEKESVAEINSTDFFSEFDPLALINEKIAQEKNENNKKYYQMLLALAEKTLDSSAGKRGNIASFMAAVYKIKLEMSLDNLAARVAAAKPNDEDEGSAEYVKWKSRRQGSLMIRDGIGLIIKNDPNPDYDNLIKLVDSHTQILDPSYSASMSVSVNPKASTSTSSLDVSTQSSTHTKNSNYKKSKTAKLLGGYALLAMGMGLFMLSTVGLLPSLGLSSTGWLASIKIIGVGFKLLFSGNQAAVGSLAAKTKWGTGAVAGTILGAEALVEGGIFASGGKFVAAQVKQSKVFTGAVMHDWGVARLK